MHYQRGAWLLFFYADITLLLLFTATNHLTKLRALQCCKGAPVKLLTHLTELIKTEYGMAGFSDLIDIVVILLTRFIPV